MPIPSNKELYEQVKKEIFQKYPNTVHIDLVY
jgi:hypothetical protein